MYSIYNFRERDYGDRNYRDRLENVYPTWKLVLKVNAVQGYIRDQSIIILTIKLNFYFSHHERNDYERGSGRGRDMGAERFGASPFDAIIDFARRHDGGTRTR